MRRVTLGQIFLAATIAIAVVVAAALALFQRRSHAEMLTTASRRQEMVAQRVQEHVLRELGRARRVLDDVEKGIRAGAIVVDPADTASLPAALEADLYTRVLDDPRIEEVTFTRASQLGFDARGYAILASQPRWQLSIHCGLTGNITTRLTKPSADGTAFSVLSRERAPDAPFDASSFRPAGTGEDPTKELTFSEIAKKDERAKATWSGLHWSELDPAAPGKQQRVVLTVQKTIDDRAGNLVGVLRVGMLTEQLEEITHVGSNPSELEEVERVALVETEAKGDGIHLVAKLDKSDRFIAVDDELRVVADRPPPEIAALFASSIVKGLDKMHPNRSGRLVVDGEPWLATLREVNVGQGVPGGTDGWMVAVLNPEARYTKELVAYERLLTVAFLTTLALVVAIGLALINAMRRGLAKITSSTTRMRGFDFSPNGDESAIRELDDVMQGLERAKTVVRAMGKYIPIDLVRRLYASNEEPKLGGEEAEIALMFTDIEGFTTLSEKLSPDELARRLGDYLAAMTTAIEKTGGTIDKYIGDAVMAMWGAPTPVEGHARRACAAALACMEAARKLYASSAWEGLPPLVTRFGLHEARVLVGHFGAPTRLSYTALGDGVNLAARLEPLCKQYGVVVLVSEAIYRDAKDAFVFRRMDRVAVKGKTTGIDVYELLGAKGDDIPGLERMRRYEEAFEAYLGRDFERALTLLEKQRDADPASAILSSRCKELLADPPPDGWTGVHVAKSK